MLSPFRDAENQVSPSRESKPSLTIYAHQISVQTSEVRSLLTSSLSHIAEDRQELHNVLQETKELGFSNEALTKRYGSLLDKLETTFSDQESKISELVRSIGDTATKTNIIQDDIASLSNTLNLHSKLLEKILEEQKSTKEFLVGLETKFNRVKDSPKNLNASPISISASQSTDQELHQHIANAGYGSWDTVPTLPAPTGQPPVLSDTESSISVVVDTPTTLKRPTRKELQLSQSQKAHVQPKHTSKKVTASQRSFRKYIHRRYRNLDLVVEATPDEQNTQSSQPVSEAYSSEPEKRPHKRILSPEFSLDQSEAATQRIDTQPKKGPVKRILAGPATQEEWANETDA